MQSSCKGTRVKADCVCVTMTTLDRLLEQRWEQLVIEKHELPRMGALWGGDAIRKVLHTAAGKPIKSAFGRKRFSPRAYSLRLFLVHDDDRGCVVAGPRGGNLTEVCSQCFCIRDRTNRLLENPMFVTPTTRRVGLFRESIWISPWDEFASFLGQGIKAPHWIWHADDVCHGHRAWAFSVGPRQSGTWLRGVQNGSRMVEVYYAQTHVVVFTHPKFCNVCASVYP